MPHPISKPTPRAPKTDAQRRHLAAALQKRIAAGEARLEELQQKIRLAEVRIAACRDVLWLMDTGDFPPVSHTEILSGPLDRRIRALLTLTKAPMTVAAVCTALHAKTPSERGYLTNRLSALAKQNRGITKVSHGIYRGAPAPAPTPEPASPQH